MIKKKKKSEIGIESLVHGSQEKIDINSGAAEFLAKTHSVLAGELEVLEDDDDDGEEMSPEALKQELLSASGLLNAAAAALIYSDKFVLISDAFKPEAVKGIELPKMILKKTRDDEQTIQEKSVIMVYLDITMDAIKGNCFQQLYKAARKGPIKLQLKWLDEKEASSSNPSDSDGLSTWKFEGARIHGIDFGNAMVKRPEINMVSIEITYDNISIDGITL